MRPFIFFMLSLFSCNCLHCQIPAPENLVAYWTFDRDATGMINDSSSNGLHGTAYEISYQNQPAGRSVLFNSAKDEIHVPVKGDTAPSAVARLSSGSISVWFKYRSVADGQILPILYFGEADTGTPHNSLIIEIGHGHNIENRRLYFTIENRRFCFDSRHNLEENRWYHFVAVVSEAGNTGYLDGKPMYGRKYNLGSDSTYTDFFAAVGSAEMLGIGYGRYAQEDPFFHFKGNIDEVAIYDKALGPDEIAALYQYGRRKILGTEPDNPDVSYGPFERNVLDFWKAETVQPAPLVVYIHGGGFVSGSKENARNASEMSNIQHCLDTGVSFASISYRYATSVRLDTVLLDCGRAIQFLRSRAAEWNIDPRRVVAYGGSAGGAASLWLAVHDDLADPDNEDPVLQESSRLLAAGHLNSQSTMDCERWAEIIRVPETWVADMNFNNYRNFYKVESWEEIFSGEITALRQELDMISMMDQHDPPLYLHNLRPDTNPLTAGEVIHHPRHIKYLKQVCDSVGIESEIITEETPGEERTDLLDFFFRCIFSGEPVSSSSLNAREDLILYPNPSTGLFRIRTSCSDESIEIYNLLGNRIFSQHAEGADMTLDLSHFPNGVYIVRSGHGKSVQIVKY